MSNLALVENESQLVDTLRNSIYPGAKKENIVMVIEYCRAAKLDIMLKPVHIVPMYVEDKETGEKKYRDVIMPGINLYRIQASRSGCAGISEPEFGEEVSMCLGGVDITFPKWCKVTVKRIVAGEIVEFPAKEYWLENYATVGKEKTPNSMWKKRPYGQLAKCTEAQALRKAFPEIGSMPTAEEMEGKHLDFQEYEVISSQKTNKGVEGLKERLGLTVEPITGEIIEDSKISFDDVKSKIMDSRNTEDLSLAMDLARTMSEDDKKILRPIYKEVRDKLDNEINF